MSPPRAQISNKHGVQEFEVCDHSIVFAIKKVVIVKAPTEVRDVRSFKLYNKERFCKDVADIPRSIIEYFDDIDDVISIWNSLKMDFAKPTTVEKTRVIS